MKKNYKLKELRSINNLSQLDMAKLLGLSESTYNHKENGIRDFTESEISLLINILECSADKLFFAEEVAKITNKQGD